MYRHHYTRERCCSVSPKAPPTLIPHAPPCSRGVQPVPPVCLAEPNTDAVMPSLSKDFCQPAGRHIPFFLNTWRCHRSLISTQLESRPARIHQQSSQSHLSCLWLAFQSHQSLWRSWGEWSVWVRWGSPRQSTSLSPYNCLYMFWNDTITFLALSKERWMVSLKASLVTYSLLESLRKRISPCSSSGYTSHNADWLRGNPNCLSPWGPLFISLDLGRPGIWRTCAWVCCWRLLVLFLSGCESLRNHKSSISICISLYFVTSL